MTCRICGNTDHNTTYEAREMMFGLREPFTYVQCGACGCLQIASIPDELARYYRAGYSGFAPPLQNPFAGLEGAFRRERYRAALWPDRPLSRLFHSIAPVGEPYQLLGRLKLTETTRVLDVGAGRGRFLYPLYELGLTRVLGIDPFIDASLTYPNGYQVRKQFIHEVAGSWEVITFQHSFEHVPDPLETLRTVRRLLTDKGTCLIRIPTVSSFAWEHYRTDWFQLDAPRHLYLHSVRSLELLARQAGLRLVEVVYDSDYQQFLFSERYRHDVALHEKSAAEPSGLTRKWKKWNYARRARRLNAIKRGDQAAFFLKKA